MRSWFLPATLLIFAMLSVLTLSSIAPQLAPRQLMYVLLGSAIFLLASKIRFNDLLRLSPLGYATTIFSLILVLIIGLSTRGTSRWIEIGDFRLQPSQLAIPFVGLFLSRLVENRNLRKLKEILLILAVTAIPGILILIEPDLGTTLVFLATVGTIIYFKDLNWRHIFLIGGVGLIAVVFAWLYILQPYQKLRITSFLSSTEETGITAANYNAQQALIAVGSGQLFGRGLGQGIQSHLRFLPERQTDFIFASLAEEFGFVGSVLLIGLYAVLTAFLIYVGSNSQKESETLFCYMVASMILIQAGINIGMNMGLLPITGITLPLLSYGGSSILTVMGTLGIVQSIVIRQKKQVRINIA